MARWWLLLLLLLQAAAQSAAPAAESSAAPPAATMTAAQFHGAVHDSGAVWCVLFISGARAGACAEFAPQWQRLRRLLHRSALPALRAVRTAVVSADGAGFGEWPARHGGRAGARRAHLSTKAPAVRLYHDDEAPDTLCDASHAPLPSADALLALVGELLPQGSRGRAAAELR